MMTHLQLPTKELTDKDQEEYLRARIKDRYWRLNNLYWIKSKAGKRIKFKLNLFQEVLYRTLWYFNIVLKARQLGITTFFCILYLDAVLFSSHKTAGIIAHTEKDAKKIFKDKVKFAFDNLPPTLRNELEIKTDSTEELSFKNGSSIFVSVSTRSGTVQYLHISEFGYTCKKYPEKAEEIVTGAINSVEQGNYVSIESTAHTRQGYFFDFCQTAQNNKRLGKKLSKLDFRFFFFAWWQNDAYTLDSKDVITVQMVQYFSELEEKERILLTEGQKQWYIAKKNTLGDKMFSEYPSTSEEAFLANQEGAYYSKFMNKALTEKRVTNVPHDPKAQVDTWWDLGRDDYNVIIFTQTVRQEIHFIDLYWSRDEGLAHYVNILGKKRDELGYNYRNHYLPHDVEVHELTTNKTRLDTLRGLGMSGIRVVPKLAIEDGIELTRNLFNRFWFDQAKCERLVNALINYRKEYDDKLGVFKDHPLHNEDSNFADPIRSLGVCFRDDLTMTDDDRELIEKGNRYGLFPEVG